MTGTFIVLDLISTINLLVLKNISQISRFFIFILTLAVFSSCSDDGGSDGPPDVPVDRPRTSEDVIADYNNLTINEGVNDLQLESLADDVFWNFRLIVPEGATESNKRPLVLRLHGAAKSGSADAHKSTECLVEPAFEGKDVFILSPNSNGLDWYTQFNMVQVQALLDLVTSDQNIDTDRIVIRGYSDGGNGSWFFAQHFSNLFKAAIPMASSYPSPDNTGYAHKFDIPLYVIHGSDDDLFPVEDTEMYVNAAIDAGSEIEFEVAEGLIHTAPCDYVSHLKEAVAWLEEEVW